MFHRCYRQHYLQSCEQSTEALSLDESWSDLDGERHHADVRALSIWLPVDFARWKAARSGNLLSPQQYLALVCLRRHLDAGCKTFPDLDRSDESRGISHE